MASIHNDIRAALETELSNVSGLPSIAYENVSFSPTTGQSYIQVRYIPTLRRPAVRGLNPQQRYDGLYSLLICTPEGLGPGAGYDVADLLLSRFDATTDISNNGLIISVDYSEVRTSFLDSPFYCTPITVAW